VADGAAPDVAGGLRRGGETVPDARLDLLCCGAVVSPRSTVNRGVSPRGLENLSVMRLIMACLLVALVSVPARAEAPADAKAAIEAVVLGLPEAWNRQNAEQFSASFTEPHDYVAVGGMFFPRLSRVGNAQAHARIWKNVFGGGSKIAFEIVSIDQVTPDVALVVVKNRNDYVENGQPASLDSILTMTLLKTADGWRIRQFNNNRVSGGPPKPNLAKPPAK
jgi:uncharacterized protein (TIGR02246 family)